MDRKNLLVSSIFLLLFLSSAYAIPCAHHEKRIYLAAVTGENSGGVFQLVVETRPGNGSVYTAVSPRIGFATQESEEAAVDYAFWSTAMDRKECDVLFRIVGQFGESSVDGPSAGGAMAVATRAALLNRSIRQDVVMTGTISQDGKIGEVGGVIEKSLGASEEGAKYFLVPTLMVHEAFLISTMSKAKDFHAIEVQTVQDAEKVLFSDYSQKFTPSFKPESKPVPPGLAPIPLDADLGRFSLVAKKVVDELQSKAKEAFADANGSDAEAMQGYFGKEISKYYRLIPAGYVFTAANAAFLLSIDAEYVKIGDTPVDLDGSISDVSSCVKSLSAPKKTAENFHWSIGSDLRRTWADKKLNETVGARFSQGGYTTLRDLLYAYSWCGISRELAAQAGDIGGEAADESVLSALADAKIREAADLMNSSKKIDYDALWHLENGMEANGTGQFGAAIYEATYAETMQKVATENVENLSGAAEKLSGASRQTLWGKIYQGQGLYLYAEAKEGKFSPSDAYRILRYAQEIDRAALDIDRELLKKPSEIPKGQQPAQAQEAEKPDGFAISAALAACVALTGVLVAYRAAMNARRR